MAAGSGVPARGWQSAFGIAEETTYGTLVTSTAWIEFNSESLKMTREEQKLESINGSRDFTKRVLTNDVVEGSIEVDFVIDSDGIMYMLKQAMGGTVSTVALSAGVSYTHTFVTGDMESNDSTVSAADVVGLSMMVRRGDTSVWGYYGTRINTFTLKGEVGAPCMFSAEIIGKGASLTTSIGAVAYSDVLPAIFKGITIKLGDSITNIGTTECYTSFELTVNNNLDGDQRCLGSREVAILPPNKREVMLKLGQRFDTITSYSRALQNTLTAIEITIDSEQTMTSSGTTSSMVIKLPECYVNMFQPEVGGNEVLEQELEYSCMYSSEQGYSIQMVVQNGTSGY